MQKMHVTSQYEVYEQVGRQAMSDLVHGHLGSHVCIWFIWKW